MAGDPDDGEGGAADEAEDGVGLEVRAEAARQQAGDDHRGPYQD